MCLSVPAKVVEIKGASGKVEFGGGVRRDVDLTLVDVKIGDYVIVHAGFAIEKLDEQSARDSLEVWAEIEKFASEVDS
ncbi:MAG: HypC/HybG/HupF family hydrogenase formation chaperone [Candidatus Heimdallarchaeota archaeon]